MLLSWLSSLSFQGWLFYPTSAPGLASLILFRFWFCFSCFWFCVTFSVCVCVFVLYFVFSFCILCFRFVFGFTYFFVFVFVSEQNILSSRFTQTAHRVIRKLTETRLSEADAHEREVIWVYIFLGCIQYQYIQYNIQYTVFIHFCSKVLMLQLRENSKISACGFFVVDRSLVTSFLATTFTYWVILIQFQTM